MSFALVVILPFVLTPMTRHSAIWPYPCPAFTRDRSAQELPAMLLDPNAVSTAKVRSSVLKQWSVPPFSYFMHTPIRTASSHTNMNSRYTILSMKSVSLRVRHSHLLRVYHFSFYFFLLIRFVFESLHWPLTSREGPFGCQCDSGVALHLIDDTDSRFRHPHSSILDLR